jgi:hypothetical protein
MTPKSANACGQRSAANLMATLASASAVRRASVPATPRYACGSFATQRDPVALHSPRIHDCTMVVQLQPPVDVWTCAPVPVVSPL